MTLMLDPEALRRRLSALSVHPRGSEVFGSSRHGWRLQPPWSAAAIATFEARHGICLPIGYRAFLGGVASSGAGPLYGLFEPGTWVPGAEAESWEGTADLAPLAEPFPYQQAWNLPGERIEELWAASDEGDDRIFAEYLDPAIARGAMPIADMGCAIRVLLVISGPEAGRIWIDDRANGRGIWPEDGLGFTTWYESWLAAAEAQVEMRPRSRGRGPAGRPTRSRSVSEVVDAALLDRFLARLQEHLAAARDLDLGDLGAIELRGSRATFRQGPALLAAVQTGAAIPQGTEAGVVLAQAYTLARTGVAVQIGERLTLWLDEPPAWSVLDYLGRERSHAARPLLSIAMR